ncbi:hypothetical protein ASPACDRAFT_76085 [Aspergillus aculeatus ATCC 16872]|uniref:Uncharacterized protein n=1 Tax=Aspergillus aculeatus (strain ATCC 16872 / CBS 172.66 / WB 5094) TaxID=690307 RepID=A0A1L9X3H1_ASPA1|nr:uncharacterized protein ASPACDRAFT_76085 [Aspergillus aculeatus ATCC 16872]OJK03015.1 hypothetical protein ASPACDRAFT_76085 [Aspergillus aculeatus ATCC 16872]
MVVETRQQSGRKRRVGSVSGPEPQLSASTQQTIRQSNNSHAIATPSKNRRQPRKKVRFSDPGPQLHAGSDYGTGLTPAMLRTSFEERADIDPLTSSPSRRSRRHSTPLWKTRSQPHSPASSSSAGVEQVFQFTPLRQLLDSRTQRRIRRVGLSDEINQLEREKRDAARYERTLQTLLRERDSLKQELDSVKRIERLPKGVSLEPADGPSCDSPRSLAERLESETHRMRQELSFSRDDLVDSSSVANTENDTIIVNESGFDGETMLISDSPDLRSLWKTPRFGIDGCELLRSGSPNADAETQLSLPDHDSEAEINALFADLETARKEKRALFEACRFRIASFGGTTLEPHLHRASPPPDFVDQLIPSLAETLGRASDATQSLNSIKEELSELGFPGVHAEEIIADMRNQFRSARLRLERAIPGETPNIGLNDGCATLSALIKRIEILIKNLADERARAMGSSDRERALRVQFDKLLARYEDASRKISGLEESIAGSASDMLHTRMRMQELEKEGEEQAVGIDRLNAALNRYREEIRGLETLVTELESDKVTNSDIYSQQVSKLQLQVTEQENARRVAEGTVAEREARIRELEDTVEQNRARSYQLSVRVEELELERQKAIESLKQEAAEQLEQCEKEIGTLNVVVAELNTSLAGAKSEIDSLRRSNVGLEHQLQLETEARDTLLETWAAEQARSFARMKETVSNERRKAKVRAANWQLQSDELQSDSTTLGSEPITPVSMTRFIDVEAGRGEHRKRLDSGIGILTDEPEEDAAAGADMQMLLPSDPADL